MDRYHLILSINNNVFRHHIFFHLISNKNKLIFRISNVGVVPITHHRNVPLQKFHFIQTNVVAFGSILDMLSEELTFVFGLLNAFIHNRRPFQNQIQLL